MPSKELLKIVFEADDIEVIDRIHDSIKYRATHGDKHYTSRISHIELSFIIKDYITNYTNNEIDLNEAYKDMKFYFRIAEDLVRDER